MKARLFSIFFALLMVCFITPCTIKASDIVEDGMEVSAEEEVTAAEEDTEEALVEITDEAVIDEDAEIVEEVTSETEGAVVEEETVEEEEAVDELPAAKVESVDIEQLQEAVVPAMEEAAPDPAAEEIKDSDNGGLLSATATGWVKSGGKWYYYSTNQGMLKRGVYYIYNDGANYAFWPDGSLVTGGWRRIDVEQSDGSYAKKWVYASSGGKLLKGWQKLDGKWYYFDTSCPTAYENGMYTIGGKKYYFNSSCVMRTGWIKISSTTWLWANSSGELASGWRKIDGVWYYFNTSSRTMYYGGYYDISGNRYYFAANGKMRTGWIKDGGHWFYAASSGKLVKGWLKVSGEWYYFDSNYAMISGGLYEIPQNSGKSYYFKDSGAIYINGTYYITEDGITYRVTFDSDGVITNVVKI